MNAKLEHPVSNEMRPFKLLCGGQLIDGASTMEVINPASGQVLVKCPRELGHAGLEEYTQAKVINIAK